MSVEIKIKINTGANDEVVSSAFTDKDEAIKFIERIVYEVEARLDNLTGGDHE